MSAKCQPRVTALAGNLMYPAANAPHMPTSQPLRRAFDIIKAEAIRRRPENLQENGDPIAYAEIARRIGLKSRQAVGHWFRGRGEPSVQQMKDMAQVLGCHWLELVTDEATVLYREEDIARHQKVGQLSPAQREELDRFIEFQLANKER